MWWKRSQYKRYTICHNVDNCRLAVVLASAVEQRCFSNSTDLKAQRTMCKVNGRKAGAPTALICLIKPRDIQLTTTCHTIMNVTCFAIIHSGSSSVRVTSSDTIHSLFQDNSIKPSYWSRGSRGFQQSENNSWVPNRSLLNVRIVVALGLMIAASVGSLRLLSSRI